MRRYSTAAAPRAKTIQITQLEGLQIRARNEDVATAVAIRYERIDSLTVNGVTSQYPVIVTDIYPPTATGREERAVSETVQLAGFARSEIKAQIVCASFPADFESETIGLPFWKRFHPRLTDPRVKLGAALTPAIATITTGSFARTATDLGDGDDAAPIALDTTLPRYLIAGEIAPWMEDASGGELKWQRQDLSALFNMDFYDSNAQPTYGVIHKVRNSHLPVKLIATNAPAGVSEFSMQTDLAEGETIPVGLAQYLYGILSVLGYAGSFKRIQSECDGLIRVGHRLNITGGDPAWATMNALVQSTEEDIDRGETTITFGLAPGLSLGRILELMRNARTRRRWTAAAQQSDGTLASTGAVELGRVTADTNSIPGMKVPTYFATKDGELKASMDASGRAMTIESSAANTGKFSASVNDTGALVLCNGVAAGILTAGLSRLQTTGSNAVMHVIGGNQGAVSFGSVQIESADCNGKALRVREMDWCSTDGVHRGKIMVVCSTPYSITP